MAYGTVNVDNLISSDGGVISPNINSLRNRIINGAMVIDQRNAGASVTATSDGQYTLDRWKVGLTVSSKFSVQQSSTAPAGFSNSLLVTSLSAYSVGSGDTFLFQQNIEGFNTADLSFGTANAKTVTLSFQVYSSLTGTFGGSLINSAANRSYPFSYTVSSANTWTQISITIAGDTSGTWVGATNGIGLGVRFGLGSGSSFSGTAGAWATGNIVQPTSTVSVVGTNGATFYVTGVQLEKGSTATSFDYRPYGTELQLCQRYYEVLSYNTSEGFCALSAVMPAGSNNRFQWSFKVTKRAASTVALASGSWVNATPTIYGGIDFADFVNTSTYFYASGTAGNPALSSSAEL